MEHYGDIRQLNGTSVPVPDCVIGGSPCQDLSIAGKRAGLAGEQSGLFLEQIRLIKEMRECDRINVLSRKAVKPRFMLWENVLYAKKCIRDIMKRKQLCKVPPVTINLVGTPGNQLGVLSISSLSYNKGSNWLTISSLGYYVRFLDSQPSPCCSVRFQQVEPSGISQCRKCSRHKTDRIGSEKKMVSSCVSSEWKVL